MQETKGTWIWSLGWEDPLEEEMATHSSALVWRIPWTEEPGGLQSVGSQNWTALSDWATCACVQLRQKKDDSLEREFRGWMTVLVRSHGIISSFVTYAAAWRFCVCVCVLISIFKNLFIWLSWVFVALHGLVACGIFSCDMQDLVPRPGSNRGPRLGGAEP